MAETPKITIPTSFWSSQNVSVALPIIYRENKKGRTFCDCNEVDEKDPVKVQTDNVSMKSLLADITLLEDGSYNVKNSSNQLVKSCVKFLENDWEKRPLIDFIIEDLKLSSDCAGWLLQYMDWNLVVEHGATLRCAFLPYRAVQTESSWISDSPEMTF